MVTANHASVDLGTGADQLTLLSGTNFAQLGAADGVSDLVDISVNTGAFLDLTYQFSDLGTGNSNVVWDFTSGVDRIKVPSNFTYTNNLDLDGDRVFDDARVVASFPSSNFQKTTVFVDSFLKPGDFV